MSTPSPSSGRRVLVTGGAGYIGSHTVLQLLLAGDEVVVIDNLINSSQKALDRVTTLAGRAPSFVEVDLRDAVALERLVFASAPRPFDACIHFAGLKSVGESVAKPLLYYDHNVTGALNLLRLLAQYSCKKVVFSSSATVYGLVETNPIAETAPLSTTSPYGQTKLVIEEILRDLARAPVPAGEEPWRIVILRYFNPIGAHPSGLIGEDPLGIPNNLLPFVMQVAVGRRAEVNVFGGDYATPDGTGVRDYIHVEDLATGHLAALEHGIFGKALGDKSCDSFNLGTGVGVSVLEMIRAAEQTSGKTIAYKVGPRRLGDVTTCFADASKANSLLQWRATRTLAEAVADSWRWQERNPQGFATPEPQAQ